MGLANYGDDTYLLQNGILRRQPHNVQKSM
jgi:hypothetical protein